MTADNHAHQIQLALRTAAGHSRAAHQAEAEGNRAYEMKMKSAGASVYEAWGLAVRAQPEYQGRKIDDKALVRLYASTKARPWWDRHLAGIKVEGKPAEREWAKRTMQWHLDPDAARARRAQAVVRSESHRRRMKDSRGARTPQGGSEGPSTRDMQRIPDDILPEQFEDPPYNVHRNECFRLLEEARRRVVLLGEDRNRLSEAESHVRDMLTALEAL